MLRNETVVSKYVRKKYIPEILEKAEKDCQDDTSEFIDYLVGLQVIPQRKVSLISNCIKMKEFKENPFLIMGKPMNCGFLTINKVLLAMQEENSDLLKCDQRLLLGTEYVLRKLLSNGHTFIEAPKLVDGSLKFLNEGVNNEKNFVTEVTVKNTINKLHREHKIKAEKTTNSLRIYNALYYDCENFLAAELARKLCCDKENINKHKIEQVIAKLEKQFGFELANTQKLAVETVINNPVAIITGSAGTGKTTVLKYAIGALRELVTDNIALVAPTGRAARRMAESTGMEASTLHSLLHIGLTDDDTDEMDVYISDDKIEADVIFIDETSMCDISIIYRLFQRVKPDCRIYFLGDPNQLPSVGSGDVLRDLIDSYYVPTVKLQVIYRQAQESNIVLNSNKILNGQSDLENGKDFDIVNVEDLEEIAETTANIYLDEVDKIGDILEVQCITPKREDGLLAAFNLNKRIQAKINPKIAQGSPCFAVNGYKIYQNDKVICGKNTETVRNGDIGIVTNATPSQLVAVFDTGEEVFNIEEAIELKIALAYCITVHKSQGSEFKSVILPIADENKTMLKRNLFYTAVTRARNKMIIVGEQRHIHNAICNNRVAKRNGMLTPRIKKQFKLYEQADKN